MKEEKKKEESEMNAVMNIERPCAISESIKRSCQEVKLMRDGKIPKRSWREFKEQMQDEIIKDDK